MFEQPARDPGPPVNDRLAWLADQLSPDASTVGPGGRLVRRWLPGGPAGAGRRRWAFAGVLVSVVVIVLGSVALFGGPPAPEPPPALPSAKPASEASARAAPQAGLVISVIGRVRSPGLVTVVQGARVADVLRAAGGAEPGADLSALNLARRVTDGEQLAVGIPAPAAAPAAAPGGAPAGAKVDLNAASTDQLDTLPGVGEVTAQRIVQWRTEHGGFTKVEQLRDVSGIGESKFEKLREQVMVG